MRMFVATTAKSADIMPEIAGYQRGRAKEQRSLGIEDEVKRIFWEVMKETKQERSVS